jgi:hypothetical protein
MLTTFFFVILLYVLTFKSIYNNIFYIKCDYYSRAETIQGRKLLSIRRFRPRKLFKGGNYSRAETIRGITVHKYVL